MAPFRLCWVFESGYFWRNTGREGMHFSSYPCDSPLDVAHLTYDEITVEKLKCNGTRVDFKQNCSDFDHQSNTNQDNNNNDNNRDTTDKATKPTTASTITSRPKAVSSPDSVISTTITLKPSIKPNVPRNVTSSSETGQTVKKYMRQDTTRLPDGFWIFIGMLIMVLPVVLATILFKKYLKPCFQPPLEVKEEDNPIYIKKLTLEGIIPSGENSNNSHNDPGHVNQGLARDSGEHYFDFMHQLEQR